MDLLLREGPFCSEVPDSDETDRIKGIILKKTIDYMKRNKRKVIDLLRKLAADARKDPKIVTAIRRVIGGCQKGGSGDLIMKELLGHLGEMVADDLSVAFGDGNYGEDNPLYYDDGGYGAQTEDWSITWRSAYEFMLFIIFSTMIGAALEYAQAPPAVVGGTALASALFRQFRGEIEEWWRERRRERDP
jgi:hypothetical protein